METVREWRHIFSPVVVAMTQTELMCKHSDGCRFRPVRADQSEQNDHFGRETGAKTEHSDSG